MLKISAQSVLVIKGLRNLFSDCPINIMQAHVLLQPLKKTRKQLLMVAS
jgi:hypothetical protein